jgi:hypothetical protein
MSWQVGIASPVDGGAGQSAAVAQGSAQTVPWPGAPGLSDDTQTSPREHALSSAKHAANPGSPVSMSDVVDSTSAPSSVLSSSASGPVESLGASPDVDDSGAAEPVEPFASPLVSDPSVATFAPDSPEPSFVADSAASSSAPDDAVVSDDASVKDVGSVGLKHDASSSASTGYGRRMVVPIAR